MPAVKINVNPDLANVNPKNPLPQLLHTPAGLAIIEIQGTIHAPFADAAGPDGVQVGKLEFPLYNSGDNKEGAWMKKVYLYIGQYQRLTGDIKKLTKPMAVLAKRDYGDKLVHASGTTNAAAETEELDMLAIVRYKVLFSSRPEPVGYTQGNTATT